MQDSRFIISLLLENQPGALARVANLFSARGYNIEALNVSPTHDPTLSHMTITTNGNDSIVRQICSQLEKLVDVFALTHTNKGSSYQQELAMVLLTKGSGEKEAQKAIKNFGGHATITILDNDCVLLQLVAVKKQIETCIKKIPKTKLTLLARTGTLAVPHEGYNP